MRPAFYLDDVKNAEFRFVKAQKAEGAQSMFLKNISKLTLFHSLNLPDGTKDKVTDEKF